MVGVLRCYATIAVGAAAAAGEAAFGILAVLGDDDGDDCSSQRKEGRKRNLGRGDDAFCWKGACHCVICYDGAPSKLEINIVDNRISFTGLTLLTN